jgi:hypothetical protein
MLGVMPRGERQYSEHPVDVETLRGITQRLEEVYDGWAERQTALFVERQRLVPNWPRLPDNTERPAVD